jgi:plastocyanin
MTVGWRDRRRVVLVLALGATAALLAAARGSNALNGGSVHRTQLRVVMRGQRFVPARLEASAGDTVRFELESGAPHNVAFNVDSIPPGALDRLARNLGTAPRPLSMSGMLLAPGEAIVLPLSRLPPGTYVFYCAPHYGGGMRGELVIKPAE